MKNILYTIILSFLFSFSVFADWGEGVEYEGNKFYLDFDTLERNNGKVYIWSLADFKKKMESGALSGKTLFVFDCSKIPKRYSVISIKTYSGNMGKGKLLLSESNERGVFDWQYPAPDSIYSILMNNLCKQ